MDDQVNELVNSVNETTNDVDAAPEVTENSESAVDAPVTEEPATDETTEQAETAEEQTEIVEEVAGEETQQTDEQAVSTRSQIYVGGISYSSKEEDLKTYFSKFGEVSKLTLSKTKKQPDGKQGHRGFAFVAYKDPSIAKTVINMGSHNLGGRELRVNAAKPKTVKIFVGGINKEATTDDSIKNYFSQFGEIEDCFCIKDRGFGFVTMVEDGDNITTILEQGKHEIDGTMCDVKTAKPKQEDRRDGGRGGRGGRGRQQQGGYGGPWGGMPYGGYPGYGAGAYGGWGGQQRYSPYGQQGGYGSYGGGQQRGGRY